MGCSWMIVVGGGLEAIGFAFVVAELARIQWREFGTPKTVLWVSLRTRRARAWWRRLVMGRQRVETRWSSSFGIGGAGEVSTEGYGWHSMGPEVEDRLGTMERNLTTLHEQHKRATGKLHEQVRNLEHDLRSTRSAIDQREKEREQARQSSLRANMRVQIAATGFFLSGLLLSVLGGVTTC